MAARPLAPALPRRAIGAMAGMIVLAGAIVWGMDQREASVKAAAASATTRKAQALVSLAESQDARSRLEANLIEYERLRTAGFVGAPDRVGLIEALESASRRLQGAAVHWNLEAARVVRTIDDPRKGQKLADVSVIPMGVTSDDIHEVEWLDMIGSLRSTTLGQARVEGCVFIKGWMRESTTVAALRVDCAISWVYITPAETPALGQAK